MSRSYTTRGSYARNMSGGRPTRQDEQLGQSASGEQSHENACEAPEKERCQRREAYTMIAPNEDKRKKLLEVQQRDDERLRQRKEMKGKTPIKMTPGRVGGQGLSQAAARNQQQQQTKKSQTLKSIEMRQKREKWNQEKRKKEEQEIQEKKAAARLQAEKNEKKASLCKETVRRYWDEKYQPHSSDRSAEHQEQSYYYSDRAPANDSEEDDDDLLELCRIYPECERSTLREILHAQGSIDGVRELLG